MKENEKKTAEEELPTEEATAEEAPAEEPVTEEAPDGEPAADESDAIAADCEAGNMVQLGSFHSGIIMETNELNEPLRMISLDINKKAEHAS